MYVNFESYIYIYIYIYEFFQHIDAITHTMNIAFKNEVDMLLL